MANYAMLTCIEAVPIMRKDSFDLFTILLNCGSLYSNLLPNTIDEIILETARFIGFDVSNG